MNRRTFLRGTSAAVLTTVVSAGAAAATTTDAPDGDATVQFVALDCNCDGTYEACCVDGPCNCEAVRTLR